jgi:hypothetical protein
MNELTVKTASKRKRISALLVASVGTLVSLLILALYLGDEARGDMGFLTMPGLKWGMPQPLKDRGMRPLYLDKVQAGWDGQFYFWIANDPVGNADTISHIDTPPYRYQRIGMPLCAWLLSKLTLQSWVSPTTFYFTSLAAVFLATYYFAFFLIRSNRSPWLALIWSLGGGAQLTLLNGLPDVFSEAMLVIAILALAQKAPSLIIYSISMCLCVLSREAYVLAAGILPYLYFLRVSQTTAPDLGQADAAKISLLNLSDWNVRGFKMLASLKHADFKLNLTLATLPIGTFLLWHIHVIHRFGPMHTDGLLGPFLYEYVRFLLATLHGTHPVFDSSIAPTEAVMLIAFGLMLLVYTFVIIKTFRCIVFITDNSLLGLACAPVVFLYCFFGPVVMMHYSGYIKASNVILFLAVYAIATAKNRQPSRFMNIAIVLLAICSATTFQHFTSERVIRGSLRNSQPSTLTENSYYHDGIIVTNGQLPIKSFNSEIQINGNSSFYAHEMFRELRGLPEIRTFNVTVTNLGLDTYERAVGYGAVRLSYHWLSSDHLTVLKDGLRTYLQTPLAPGAKSTLAMHVEYPSEAGDYVLRISLVQEGVAWFYQVGGAYADLHVHVY